MKRLILITLIAGAFLIRAGDVSATVLSSKNGTVDIARDEVIDDDLFVGAQNVTIDGTVNGDVFAGAQTVTIRGSINGNLHIGAQVVSLSGTVRNNAYIGAQNVTVSGSDIGGSLIVGSQNLSVDKDTKVGGSLLAGSGNVSIDNDVGRSVYVGAGSMSLGPDAAIGKDLYYSTPVNQAHIDQNAQIAGSVHKSEFKAPPKNTQAIKKQAQEALIAFQYISWFISLIGALIIGFIYMKLFGRNLETNSAHVTASPWKSLGIGFLATIVFIPAVLILFFTLIGIPVAVLAILLFLLYGYLAKIVVGFAFGKWLVGRMNWRATSFWAFALGLFVIYVLELIPFIGFLTGVAVFWLGLGAQTLTFFSHEKREV